VELDRVARFRFSVEALILAAVVFDGSTCGIVVSDFTLGSQNCCCIAVSSAGPLTSGLACDQRAAETTSSG
jgi:hypothetical protein